MLRQETAPATPRPCTWPYSNVAGEIRDATGPCEVTGDLFGPYQTRWLPAVSNEIVVASGVVLIFLLSAWNIKGAAADQGQVFSIGGRKVRVKRKAGDSAYTLKI